MTSTFDSRDEALNERTRIFKEFLEEDFGASPYTDKIQKMIEQGNKRLIININHLREYNSEYCTGLLSDPMEFFPPFERALNEIVNATTTIVPEPGMDLPTYYIGLEGSFGANLMSPRLINSSHLGKLLCIEAIVTRCNNAINIGSLVRPKIAKSVHYCEATQMFITREYRDGQSLSDDLPTSSVYPTEDENGNALTTEFGYSTYKDFQMIYVQEMPERSPAGQIPRSIDVLLEQDLVDLVKPGDRIQISGVYRSRGKNAASSSAVFSTLLLANNITLLNKEIAQPTLTEKDTREIRKISKRSDVFKLLSTSLAPSLFGHEYIKKALLLLMLGGVEKNLENGTHLRGDINILLIGDPSVGKSQMLRFVLNLAPLAIATTGRGSSGVGLTAAVTQDKETGERTLEAGAMVLADRGVVCIDEFDKMSDVDRVAIHEVMEQQTVTIAKAGIHTSLNARCSVLAAANPAFGSYVDEKKPFENITMPDSLLSRFDLVFVVLDKSDDEFNRAIADHITRLHRYITPGIEPGTPVTEEMFRMMKISEADPETENGETPVFEKYNELLHIGIRSKRRKKQKEVEILSIPFLKKYLFYAKNRVNPVLTEEASEFIARSYSELRAEKDGANDQYRTMPITPRTLETLIRLATAHAKCRLSKKVEQEDADVAYEILIFALFKEVKKKTRTKKQKLEHSDSEDDDSDDTIQTAAANSSFIARHGTSEAPSSSRMSRKTEQNSTQSKVTDQLSYLDMQTDVTELEPSPAISVATTAQQSRRQSPVPDSQPLLEMTEERIELFRSRLHSVREKYIAERDETPTVTLQELMSVMNSNLSFNEKFAEHEIVSQLQFMSDENMSLWWQAENKSVLFF